MGISSYITLAKEVFIVAALGYILWFIHTADQNAVKVKDLEAVTKQLTLNAAQTAKWQQETNDAFAEANSQMGNLAHSIDANHSPVIVRIHPSSGALPNAPSTPGSLPTCPRSGDDEAGSNSRDLRPDINEYEKWVEEGFANCRALKAAWPK